MKNKWLIRTTKKQIVGPVRIEKILELHANGHLNPDDELCSGNGYWFWVREVDLFSKFVENGISQSFNPISEAANVLTPTSKKQAKKQRQSDSTTNEDITRVGGINLNDLQESSIDEDSNDENILPVTDDLEFPKVDSVGKENKTSQSADNTISEIPQTAPGLKEETQKPQVIETKSGGGEEILIPSDDDLAYPDMGDFTAEILLPNVNAEKKESEKTTNLSIKKKNKKESKKREIKRKTKKIKRREEKVLPARNDRLMGVFALIIIVLLGAIIFYYLDSKNLVKNAIFPTSAYAQVNTFYSKKKN